MLNIEVDCERYDVFKLTLKIDHVLVKSVVNLFLWMLLLKLN